ncbi:MAG: DUF5320 domain-containing protein [Thermodesulfobacteriota bacterium]
MVMPGYDGTGPRGQGPMSGGGRGFCVLQAPEAPGESMKGFAGIQGQAVFGNYYGPQTGLVPLKTWVRLFERRLEEIRDRLAALGEGQAGRGAGSGGGLK